MNTSDVLISDAAGMYLAGTTGLRLPPLAVGAAFHKLRFTFRDHEGVRRFPVLDNEARIVLYVRFPGLDEQALASDNPDTPWTNTAGDYNGDDSIIGNSFVYPEGAAAAGLATFRVVLQRRYNSHDEVLVSGTVDIVEGGGPEQFIPLTIQYARDESGVEPRQVADWPLLDLGYATFNQSGGCIFTDLAGNAFNDGGNGGVEGLRSISCRMFVPLGEGGWTHATIGLMVSCPTSDVYFFVGFAHDIVSPTGPIWTRDAVASEHPGVSFAISTRGGTDERLSPAAGWQALRCPELAGVRYLVIQWEGDPVAGFSVDPVIMRSR